MAQNEMRARRGLPSRVRSTEGLGLCQKTHQQACVRRRGKEMTLWRLVGSELCFGLASFMPETPELGSMLRLGLLPACLSPQDRAMSELRSCFRDASTVHVRLGAVSFRPSCLGCREKRANFSLGCYPQALGGSRNTVVRAGAVRRGSGKTICLDCCEASRIWRIRD